MLERGIGRIEREGDGQTDEVDVADVGEELGVVEGEFGESERGANVGVALVVDGGFHQAWAGVHSENEGRAEREPDAATC